MHYQYPNMSPVESKLHGLTLGFSPLVTASSGTRAAEIGGSGYDEHSNVTLKLLRLGKNPPEAEGSV